VAAKGQTIDLQAGRFNRLYLIAVADGDQKAAFRLGDKTTELTIENWGGFIGSWDDRVWKSGNVAVPPRPGQPAGAASETRFDRFAELVKINPGFIKRDPVAWFASHHHTADGKNEPYSYSYLFAYALELPANARTVTLPDNGKIRILAISVGGTRHCEAIPPRCMTGVMSVEGRGWVTPALGSIWSTRNRRNRLISTEGGSLRWVTRAG